MTWLGLELFALLAICYGASYAIMRALHRLNQRSYRLFRFIVLPGVIIHELSHAVACMLTATPIVEMNFWTETGGHVVHHRPKWPVITQPIISLAPFLIGTAALLYMPHYIITMPWYVSIVLLWILASIGATLAPSTTDLAHAAEGLAVLTVIGGGIIYAFPSVVTELEPTLTVIRNQLVFVASMLLGIFLIFKLLHTASHRS